MNELFCLSRAYINTGEVAVRVGWVILRVLTRRFNSYLMRKCLALSPAERHPILWKLSVLEAQLRCPGGSSGASRTLTVHVAWLSPDHSFSLGPGESLHVVYKT